MIWQARNDESSLDKASSSAPIKEVVQKRGRSRSDAAGPKRGARGQKKGAASNVLEPERMRLPRLLDRDKWEEEAATAWVSKLGQTLRISCNPAPYHSFDLVVLEKVK